MQLSSKLLSAGFAAAILGGAPASAQNDRYPLIRSLLQEDAAKRDAAIGRCAASIAPTLAAVEPNAAARPTFDIIGFQHRNNGDLRIFGSASAGRFGKPVEFSCDVDPRGNLTRLDLAAVD